MDEGTQRSLSHAFQQFPKRRIARKVRSQGYVVNEKSNEILGFEAIAVGDVSSDYDVLSTRVAMENGVKGSQKQHKNRHVFPLDKGLNRFQ